MNIAIVGSKPPTSWYVPRTKARTMKELKMIVRWKNGSSSQPHVNVAPTADPACDITCPDYSIVMIAGEKYTTTYSTGTPIERSKQMLGQLMNLYVPTKGAFDKQMFKLNSNSRRMALAMFISIISLQLRGGCATFEFPNELFTGIHDILYMAYMLYEKVDISITRTNVRVKVSNFINPVSENIIVKLLYAYKHVDVVHACCEIPLFCKQVLDESAVMMRIYMNNHLATTKQQVILSQSPLDHSIQIAFQQSGY